MAEHRARITYGSLQGMASSSQEGLKDTERCVCECVSVCIIGVYMCVSACMYVYCVVCVCYMCCVYVCLYARVHMYVVSICVSVYCAVCDVYDMCVHACASVCSVSVLCVYMCK